LIEALEASKEKARKKPEEEAMLKAEKADRMVKHLLPRKK
jgi:hypothetical protein